MTRKKIPGIRISGNLAGHPDIPKSSLSEADQDGYQVDVMSYMLSYYSVENAGKELGKLVVSVKLNELEKMVQLDSDLLEGYCLYDSNAEPVICHGRLKKDYDTIQRENENGIIESSHGDVYIVANEMDDNCLLVSEISGTRLMERAVRGNLYLLAIFAIIMGALLYILPRVIRQIVTPVNQLSAAAVEVGQGNFDVSVDIHTDDELEMLADVFNKMVVDIQDYMHQSVEHENVLRRMQIENLML
ncbi:MAG: HAMP domain-containing protein [Blautia sp.]